MTPTPQQEQEIERAWKRYTGLERYNGTLCFSKDFRAGAVSQLARVEALDQYREKLNQEHTEALQEMVKVEAERNELRLCVEALEKELAEWKAKWEDLNRHIQLRDLRR